MSKSKLSKKKILLQVDKIDGWLNEPVVNLLYDLASGLKDNSKICEIGSWKGKSTCLLALASLPSVKVIAIDPHTGSHEHKHMYGQAISSFDEYIKNLEDCLVFQKVSSLKLTSREASEKICEDIDLLWIDGSHTYEDVSFDLRHYFELVSINGWVALHDYKWPGVKRCIWDLLDSDLPISFVRRVEDTHYFRRLSKQSRIYSSANKLRLNVYKFYQLFKNRRRRWKKRLGSVVRSFRIFLS